MAAFVVFLVVAAFVLAANVGKKLRASSRSGSPTQAGAGLEQIRLQLLALKEQGRTGVTARWRTPRGPMAVPAPPRGWTAPPPPEVQRFVAQAQPVITDLRDDPAIAAFLPDPTAESRAAADTRERRPDPTSPRERYVGSAALESTLDSTIESSLLGVPIGPTAQSAVAVGQPVNLPPGVEARVLAFLDAGHEVAAVRLICDEMDCGILDAMRTVDQLS